MERGPDGAGPSPVSMWRLRRGGRWEGPLRGKWRTQGAVESRKSEGPVSLKLNFTEGRKENEGGRQHVAPLAQSKVEGGQSDGTESNAEARRHRAGRVGKREDLYKVPLGPQRLALKRAPLCVLLCDSASLRYFS